MSPEMNVNQWALITEVGLVRERGYTLPKKNHFLFSNKEIQFKKHSKIVFDGKMMGANTRGMYLGGRGRGGGEGVRGGGTGRGGGAAGPKLLIEFRYTTSSELV